MSPDSCSHCACCPPIFPPAHSCLQSKQRLSCNTRLSDGRRMHAVSGKLAPSSLRANGRLLRSTCYCSRLQSTRVVDASSWDMKFRWYVTCLSVYAYQCAFLLQSITPTFKPTRADNTHFTVSVICLNSVTCLCSNCPSVVRVLLCAS